jgi:hypothetical protein
MPRLYPSLLNEQSVTDVATYLQQGLAHQGALSGWGFTCYYSALMNCTPRSYRFTYFYWPEHPGGRRAARG